MSITIFALALLHYDEGDELEMNKGNELNFKKIKNITSKNQN